MKKLIAIFLILSVLALLADAASAQIASTQTDSRAICRQYGAKLLSVSANSLGAVDLCQFMGNAFIEVQTLNNYAAFQVPSAAVSSYIQNNGTLPLTCQTAGARILGTRDNFGHIGNICQFGDGSIIELNTFNRGSRDISNSHLNQALRLPGLDL